MGLAARLMAGALIGGCALNAGSAGASDVNAFRAELQEIELTPDYLEGLSLDGAWVLDSEIGGFGGFSGLLTEGGGLIALTDRANFFRFSKPAPGVEEVQGRRIFMVDAHGRLADDDRDAEGLTRAGDDVLVSFERHDRIERWDGERLTPVTALADFGALPFNKGLEALATLPDGRFLALAEDEGAEARYWILGGAAPVSGRLTLPSHHRITGADLGPDGRLYAVFRDFSVLTGVSIRIGRYALEDGHPVAASYEELAAFERDSGIDNMEGIALETEGGETRLWLISDDNFNIFQRTVLVRFTVGR